MHPVNKFQRKRIATSKHKSNEEKRKDAKERSSAVWRKLTKEQLAAQEAEDELRAIRIDDEAADSRPVA